MESIILSDKLQKEIISEIQEKTAEFRLPKKVIEHLNNLYSKIWCNASYDPDNKETQIFSKKLLPDIEALNDIFKFKR